FCALQHVLVPAFARAARLPEDCEPSGTRNGLLEQLEALADQLRGKRGQPREVAGGPCEALDEPARHRIAGSGEDDRDGPGRLHDGARLGWGRDYDNVDLERDQLSRRRGESIEVGRPVFDEDVPALDVTEITHSLAEGLNVSGLGAPQVAYSSDLPRLLRLGGKRRS